MQDNFKSFHTVPLQSQLPESLRRLLTLRLRGMLHYKWAGEKNPNDFSDSVHKLTFLQKW